MANLWTKKLRKNVPRSIRNEISIRNLKRWQKWKANYECKTGFSGKCCQDSCRSNIGTRGWGPGGGGSRGKCTQKWPETDIYKATLLTCVFQKCASHVGQGANFTKNVKKLKEKGLKSMKSRKKIGDRTRHSKKCNFFAGDRFCKRGSEAKNARGCSHRLFLEGARSGHIAKRTSNGATRASENYKNSSHKRRLGVKKVRFLIEDARRRFSEMCFLP